MPRPSVRSAPAFRSGTRRSVSKAAPLVRLVEAQGSSKRGWDAAVSDALRGAKDEVDSPIAVEIARQWADLDGRGKIATYRVSVKIAHRQVIAPPRV